MSDAVIEAIKYETEAIVAAQDSRYNEALNLFQKAMDVAPSRASVYNNRAQTMRLLNDDEGKQNRKLNSKLKIGFHLKDFFLIC